MQYVIGIDGGGTKTRLRIADMNGGLIASCDGGPSNINSMEESAVKNTLKDMINEGLSIIREGIGSCRALCMGMAGAGRASAGHILGEMVRSIGFNDNILVVSDAHAALYGGTGTGIGVIVISGTGSICYGRNSMGEVCRAGGWGHILGDEGSGYDIGLKALKHVMRNYDGRDQDSLLSPRVLEHIRISCPEELVKKIYSQKVGKKEISEIAKIVDEGCILGDEAAVGIMNEATDELFYCICPVIEKLGFNDRSANVVFGGSFLLKSMYMNTGLKNRIYDTYPLVKISNIKDDASWGAVLIALEYLKEKG